MNTIGKILRLTTFGESHGPAMGGVLDGFQSRFRVDMEQLQAFINTRRPGYGSGTSPRREEDVPEFLSGLTEDHITLGTPIAFIVRNTNVRSEDYDDLRHIYRPNHADYTYDMRYGIRDWRGGGRASARETLCRVIAGGIALQWLEKKAIHVVSRLVAAGNSHPGASMEEMLDIVEAARHEGDSVGGVVECTVKGMPAGIGNPIYDKMEARLASAMMSINAATGVQIGDGFEMARMKGSEAADTFYADAEEIHTRTNHCGGIQGGITNGSDIRIRVAFKPTPSIAKELPTVNRDKASVTVKSRGRHDACVAIRAVPVVTAMAALVMADYMMEHKVYDSIL